MYKQSYWDIYNKVARDLTMTWGFLRLESALTTSNVINFTTLKNENSATATRTELRLNPADMFVVTHTAIALYKQPNGQTTGNQILHYFANPFIFNAVGEAANLQNIYNGNLQVNINDKKLSNGIACHQFERVGLSIQGNPLAFDGTDALTALRDEKDGNLYGTVPQYPYLALSGADNIYTQITLPDSVALGGTASTNYAVIMHYGWSIQNGARLGVASGYYNWSAAA